LRGTIMAIEFMGHEVNLHVEAEGHALVAVVPGEQYDRSAARGTRIALKPIESRIHLFDGETGANVSLATLN
jgi:oligogalacturonide transport system ATP-binding protein